MCGAGAGQSGDHHGWHQFDVVDLGVSGQQVGEQQPVLQPLQQLRVEVDDSGVVHAGNILQRSEIHVETLAVVVGAEVVETGVGGGLGVQHVGVERAVGRHRSHHLAQWFGLRGEAGLGEVVQMDGALDGFGRWYRSWRLMLL